MNPNQDLIDYQNQLLADNIEEIRILNFQIVSVQDAISSAQSNIEAFNNQITEFNNQIDEITDGNILINETIVILTNTV